MKQTVLCISFGLVGQIAICQEVSFASTPKIAVAEYSAQVPRLYGHCTDSLVADTVYGSSPFHPEPVMHVHRYPLARYEFFTEGPLYRRIDIRSETIHGDTIIFDNWETGEREYSYMISSYDIPNGAYHEFFPNGNIRIKGTLDGYNPDGTLKKTGTWMEWDAVGNLIREEHYP